MKPGRKQVYRYHIPKLRNSKPFCCNKWDANDLVPKRCCRKWKVLTNVAVCFLHGKIVPIAREKAFAYLYYVGIEHNWNVLQPSLYAGVKLVNHMWLNDIHSKWICVNCNPIANMKQTSMSCMRTLVDFSLILSINVWNPSASTHSISTFAASIEMEMNCWHPLFPRLHIHKHHHIIHRTSRKAVSACWLQIIIQNLVSINK